MDVLSEEDIKRIHEAALEVMEETGVRFPSEKALNILEEAGAKVDRNKMIAKLPASLVMEALSKVPACFSFAGRIPPDDLLIDEEHCYLTTGGCCIEIYDLETGIKRISTKKDVEDSALIADYLEAVGIYYGPVVSAQDVPAEVRPLHELEAAFTHTTKHIQSESIITESMAKYAVEMAVAIVGSKEELRKRPIFSILQCAIGPLGMNGGPLEACLVAAEAGIPTSHMSMSTMGSTGPATIAGTLVVTTVESLSPVVLTQIACPGAPVFINPAPAAVDLRTGAWNGWGPERCLLLAACNQIFKSYNIPHAVGSWGTGAKEPDWQAGVDHSLMALMPTLTHPEIFMGVGMLHNSGLVSFQQMIMDCEIYEQIKRITEGVEVDKETLAVDVIKKVGVGGSFLAEKHTRRYMRDIWQPTIYDCSSYEAWEKSGKKGAFAKATEKVKWILANHKPLPLDVAVEKELKRIIKAAEQELIR